ncbi:MAG: ribonuclease P protein component [Pseudomonadota bacterium]
MLDSPFNTAASSEFTYAHRLLRADGFDHVVRAEYLADKHYKIYFVRNGKRNARLGIVASKRIMPGAVQRNRVKRVIREAFRHHSIKAQRLDLVVLVRDAESQTSRSEDLKSLFSRIEDKCASL